METSANKDNINVVEETNIDVSLPKTIIIAVLGILSAVAFGYFFLGPG